MCLLNNNEVIFNIEIERLNNIKYNHFSLSYINLIKKFVKKIDYIALSGIHPVNKLYNVKEFIEFNPYISSILGIDKSFYENGVQLIDLTSQHHLTHASCAFYNSGFKNALCIIKDGVGSHYNVNDNIFLNNLEGRENGTSFVCSYPDIFNIVDKSIFIENVLEKNKNNFGRHYLNEQIYLTNSISEAMAFGIIAKDFGFHNLDAGKIMGMSAYGLINKNIPSFFMNKQINTNIFKIKNNNIIFDFNKKNTFIEKANIAHKLQKESENNVYEYIMLMIEKTKQKNVCLSGGFFLNCVANYKILQRLPKEINIYIEPMSTDAGTAMGAAKYVYYEKTKNKKIKKQTSIYYGFTNIFKEKYFKDVKVHKNIFEKDVAKILVERKIVAIYQGKSESGPRALGNRSILYDPTDPNGKNVVNEIKKREWFRPFAGSILHEFSNDWFDMDKLSESPFMMYAVNTKKEKTALVPAIVHIDGTCRVQTVTEKQNKNFYNLIKEFYKLTSVPILMNTSFNLAGDCIVETIPQAINTLKNSKIDFLYFPEKNMLVEKNV